MLSGNLYGFFGKLFKLNKLKQIEETIKELKNIFNDRFYFEIQRHNEPDEEIFGENKKFKPSKLLKMVRSKAYLFSGVEIRWRCAETCLDSLETVPLTAQFHFPGGLADYLKETLEANQTFAPSSFCGKILFSEKLKIS